MFKIKKLTLYNFEDKEYTYQFHKGINYFKGKNNSGKTEFYKFIDYMFGSSDDIRKKPWYKDTLKKALMEIEINGIIYNLVRFNNPSQNYLYCSDEEMGDAIDLREYKDKLNSIFARDLELLRSIREFTEEELTYRAFTMFNFLGEKRQGITHDFFDKCSDIKYSVKLAPILNFIFNSNLEKIHELQKELEMLTEELRALEDNSSRYNFICTQVNKNIQKLGFNIWYTGNNAEDIKKNIAAIKNMESPKKRDNEINIADLEVMFSNVSEQIKIYENSVSDAKQLEKDNSNRKILLDNLEKLLSENKEFVYLVEPLKKLVEDLDSTISFNQYTISDKTIAELKKQRTILKTAIQRNNARFECYSLEEKSKAIALIEEYLSVDIKDCSQRLKEIKKRIREIKEEIKVLQNSDDLTKIKNLSQFITDLYISASEVSSVVGDDVIQEGFKIQYLKRGNILQPMVRIQEKDEFENESKKEVQYYIGSMARHTLIQLCGYLGFLKLLLEEEKYPIIPILIIDHVSKPFDIQNAKALGAVLNKSCEIIGKENLQIIMFDDEEHTTLSLEPEYCENLVNDKKSGFNPFYYILPDQQEEIEVAVESTEGKENDD